MTTKELIEELQKADPEGNTEVVIGNIPIFFVEKVPAFYDGTSQVLIRDKTKNYYNVTGAKYVSKGHKINIHTLSIEDAIWDNPDLPVDLSEIEYWVDGVLDNQSTIDQYKQMIEGYRKAVRECDAEIERKSKENKP